MGIPTPTPAVALPISRHYSDARVTLPFSADEFFEVFAAYNTREA
jgi:hypothetical protein